MVRSEAGKEEQSALRILQGYANELVKSGNSYPYEVLASDVRIGELVKSMEARGIKNAAEIVAKQLEKVKLPRHHRREPKPAYVMPGRENHSSGAGFVSLRAEGAHSQTTQRKRGRSGTH